MKKMISTLMLCGPAALASGSTDYVCAATKQVNGHVSNLRYEYHEGEDTSASVSRVVALDTEKAKKALLDRNPLTLDASEISDLLVRGPKIDVVGCQASDAQCLAGADGTVIETLQKVEQMGHVKGQRITQTATLKDGTKIVLDIHNWDEKATEGEFSGTLSVTTQRAGFTSISAAQPMNCSVTTP